MGGFKNDCSRVIITSAGGAINQKMDNTPISRPINFVIYIEGRWNATNSPIADALEKESVIKWVHLLANQLSHCHGIRSTTHPEALRDIVSKSGKTKPPKGWYNFTPD